MALLFIYIMEQSELITLLYEAQKVAEKFNLIIKVEISGYSIIKNNVSKEELLNILEIRKAVNYNSD